MIAVLILSTNKKLWRGKIRFSRRHNVKLTKVISVLCTSRGILAPETSAAEQSLEAVSPGCRFQLLPHALERI